MSQNVMAMFQMQTNHSKAIQFNYRPVYKTKFNILYKLNFNQALARRKKGKEAALAVLSILKKNK